MTPLNPAILTGLGLVSIPIILHFIFKSRFRVIDWAAMMFFEKSFTRQARRVQFKQLILMLVRCGILMFLVLSFARYLWKSGAAVGSASAQRTSAVILLDNSYSMDYSAGVRSRFEQAKERAAQLIRSLKKGDDVAVFLVGEKVDPLIGEPTFDLDAAANAVLGAPISYGTADHCQGLDAALRAIQRARNPNPEVFIFTDMQARGWHVADDARWKFITEFIDRLKIRPGVYLLPQGPTGSDNVAVTSLVPSRAIIGNDRPVNFRVTVQNFGEHAYAAIPVRFMVDGKLKSTAEVRLEPSESENLQFEHHFDEAGSHYVEVQVDADTLDRDNRAFHAADVLETLPVLLISGDPSPEPLAGETDFLRFALAPMNRDRPEWKTLLAPRVMDLGAVNSIKFTDFRVVVLANVPHLTADMVTRLERFVSQGGGLFITLGDQVDPRLYTRDLFRAGDGLLPGAVNDLVRFEKRERGGNGNGSGEPPFTLISPPFTHPSLADFNKLTGLGQGRIRAYYKLILPEARTTAAGSDEDRFQIMATLQTKDPLLIERKFGDGNVILLTTSVDTDWNNMPVHPFYLPLMHRLVYHLASTVRPPRNVQVGETLTRLVETRDPTLKIEVKTPSGRMESLSWKKTQEGLRAAHFHDTGEPGLYLFTTRFDGKTKPSHYVANLQQQESDLRELVPEQRTVILQRLGAESAESIDELQRLRFRSMHGREVWFYLLLLAIGLAVLEVVLTRRWCS